VRHRRGWRRRRDGCRRLLRRGGRRRECRRPGAADDAWRWRHRRGDRTARKRSRGERREDDHGSSHALAASRMRTSARRGGMRGSHWTRGSTRSPSSGARSPYNAGSAGEERQPASTWTDVRCPIGVQSSPTAPEGGAEAAVHGYTTAFYWSASILDGRRRVRITAASQGLLLRPKEERRAVVGKPALATERKVRQYRHRGSTRVAAGRASGSAAGAVARRRGPPAAPRGSTR